MHNLHKLVRIIEIGVIAVLAVFAFLTYQELSALRRSPVALPNYQFEVASESEENKTVVTRGTWISEKGPPEPLLTITIECRKPRMECVESTAAVAMVSGRGLLEAQHTIFAVERWTEAEVLSKSTPGPCFSRQLVLNLKEKHAIARATASEGRGLCKELPARTLELVAGYRVREAAGK